MRREFLSKTHRFSLQLREIEPLAANVQEIEFLIVDAPRGANAIIIQLAISWLRLR
jgi:hypothetical protein